MNEFIAKSDIDTEPLEPELDREVLVNSLAKVFEEVGADIADIDHGNWVNMDDGELIGHIAMLGGMHDFDLDDILDLSGIDVILREDSSGHYNRDTGEKILISTEDRHKEFNFISNNEEEGV